MATFSLTTIREWAARQLAPSATLATKDNPVGGLIAQLVSPGQPIYTPRSFEALAREGFNSNSYIFRAISIIAEACAGIPWVLYRVKGGANPATLRRRGGKALRTEVDEHPLLDVLNHPHGADEVIGAATLIESLMAYRYLTGNAYLNALRPTSRKGPPVELWVQRPDRIRVIADASGRVSGYSYTVSGRAENLDPADVLHWKTFNPLDDWYGLSPVSVAARIVDQMNSGNDWNTALLQNAARPSGFLVTPAGKNLSDPQFERLKKELRDKYRGAKNAGAVQLLEGGISWLQVGMSPLDLQWLEGKKENAREIAVILGVPSELLGDSTNKTYSNYQEARRAFYMETVLPQMDGLRDVLNAWLVPMYDDGASLWLDYDRDDIEALQDDRDALHARAREDYAGGLLSLNEAREAVGAEAIERGDVFIVPRGALTLDQLLEGAGLPLVAGSGLPSIAAPRGAGSSGASPALPAPSPTVPLPVPTLHDSLPPGTIVDAAKVYHPWLAIASLARQAKVAYDLQAGRLKWEAQVAAQARDQFKREHDHLTALLGHSGGTTDSQLSAIQAHISGFANDWAMLLATAYQAVGTAAGNALYTAWKDAGYLPRDATYTPPQESVQALAAKLAPKAHALVTTTNTRVLRALHAALDQAAKAGERRGETKADLPGAPGEGPYHSPPRAPYTPPGAPNLMTPTQQILQEGLTGLYQGWYQLSDGDVWYDLEGGDTGDGDGFTSRADAIGITEAGGAWNGGLDDAAGLAADAYGFGVSRTWTTVGDNHVRPAHDDADGQTVQLDEPFTVGGEDLMYPGDPSGSLGNTLGCRCSIDYAVSLPGDFLPVAGGDASDLADDEIPLE